MTDARYFFSNDRVLSDGEYFKQDPQLRGVWNKVVGAWDAAAVYVHDRTYLGEVLRADPTSLEVRLWRDKHSFESWRIPDGEVMPFSKEQLQPIDAADIGTVIQYDEVKVRNFGMSRIRKIGKLDFSEGSQSMLGYVVRGDERIFEFRIFPVGITSVMSESRYLIINAQNLGYEEPTVVDVIQISYDGAMNLDEIVRIHGTDAKRKIKITRIGQVDIPFTELTGAQIDSLSS